MVTTIHVITLTTTVTIQQNHLLQQAHHHLHFLSLHFFSCFETQFSTGFRTFSSIFFLTSVHCSFAFLIAFSTGTCTSFVIHCFTFLHADMVLLFYPKRQNYIRIFCYLTGNSPFKDRIFPLFICTRSEERRV